MKKILVLGASGMAGHIIYTYLSENTDYQVVGTTNKTIFGEDNLLLDIFNLELVKEILISIKPDIIINCVGILINQSKTDPDKTIYCNAFFPHFLKNIISCTHAKLIHISTDCVFSGELGGYNENSFKDATDIYGLSKSLGEINDDTNITIRTSIIGPEIKKNSEGLFDWFMNQKNTVNGFKNSFWSGVTTLELAKFISWLIENPIVGLIHLTNETPISKYDLLTKINDVYNKNIEINSDYSYLCNKSLISIRNIEYIVGSYDKMLNEQKDFMIEHEYYYDYPKF